jgi:hypothetical protein
MFHLYQPEHIEWPVSIDLPAKGGAKESYSFMAYFLNLDQSDCQELQDQHHLMLNVMRRRLEVLQGYAKEGATMDEPLPCTFEDLADAVLCGWNNETAPKKMWVVDSEGEPIEFSDAAKTRLFRIQGAAAAVFTAWLDSLGKPSEKGAAKAGGFRAKNS